MLRDIIGVVDFVVALDPIAAGAFTGHRAEEIHAHLLAHYARQRAPNRMRLPVGSRHNVADGRATFAFQEPENAVALADLLERCGGELGRFRSCLLNRTCVRIGCWVEEGACPLLACGSFRL